MAAAAALVMRLKAPGRFYHVFAGLRKSFCASGAVTSWRRQCSSQSQHMSSTADMPVPMENPYKEPPKKCILCGITLDYKNVQEYWKEIPGVSKDKSSFKETNNRPTSFKRVEKAVRIENTKHAMSTRKICKIKFKT